MLCLPVTSSYEGCPASYWRLTVSQDDRGRQEVFSSFPKIDGDSDVSRMAGGKAAPDTRYGDGKCSVSQ